MCEKAKRFEAECGCYAPMVYRHCLHMLRRPEDAEDAAQEAMLRAFRAYDGYRGEGTASWLFSIADHLCLDLLRSPRRKQTVLPLEAVPEARDASPDPEEVYQRSARRERLLAALHRLPPEQQSVLHLAYGDGLSYQELSRLLQLPEGTVKSRLNRARNALRRLLAQEE